MCNFKLTFLVGLKLIFNCFLSFSFSFFLCGAIHWSILQHTEAKKSSPINEDISCPFFSLRYMCFIRFFPRAVRIAQTGNAIPEGWTNTRRNARVSAWPRIWFSRPTFMLFYSDLPAPYPLSFFPFYAFLLNLSTPVYFTSNSVLFTRRTAFTKKIKTVNTYSGDKSVNMSKNNLEAIVRNHVVIFTKK